MKVVLFDRSEYVVTQAQGEKLKKSLADTSSQFVTIQGAMIKKSAIAMVKPGGYTLADMPPQHDGKRLKADNRTDEEIHEAARKAAEKVRAKLRRNGLVL